MKTSEPKKDEGVERRKNYFVKGWKESEFNKDIRRAQRSIEWKEGKGRCK